MAKRKLAELVAEILSLLKADNKCDESKNVENIANGLMLRDDPVERLDKGCRIGLVIVGYIVNRRGKRCENVCERKRRRRRRGR